MSAVAWTKGGGAEVIACDDDRVSLRSTIPSAPGSRLEGALASGTAIKVKVARCRRVDEAFVIDGRLLDATRSMRDEIAAAVRA